MLDSIKSEYIYADYMKNDCNFVRSKDCLLYTSDAADE